MGEVGSISAFTESDFDELTTGLGIAVGPRIVLRTLFRQQQQQLAGLEDAAVAVD